MLDIFQKADKPHKYQGQMLDALLHVFLITLLQKHEQNLVIANPVCEKDDSNILPIMNYISREKSSYILRLGATIFTSLAATVEFFLILFRSREIGVFCPSSCWRFNQC